MARNPNQNNRGFTLVEMLVVLAIIGILAAILVPTLAVAMKTVKQGAIKTELDQMKVAIEQYRTKFGGYPLQIYGPKLRYGRSGGIDNPWLLKHVQKISRRADLALLNAFLTSDLQTPPSYVATYQSPPTRNVATMGPAEALVFALSELSQNASAPMGYIAPPSGSVMALTDANLADRVILFEFNPTRLRDLDGDGWLEYYSASDGNVPFVYFDSRVYQAPETGAIDAETFERLLRIDFETGGGVNRMYPYAATNVVGFGFAMPYILQTQSKWAGADAYQLISPGVDETHSIQPTWDTSVTIKPNRVIPSQLTGLPFDRDNLASFAELRLDAIGAD